MAESVQWAGIISKLEEKVIAYTGEITQASTSSQFTLFGTLLAYRFLDYWSIDFDGTRFYSGDTTNTTVDFWISIHKLEGILGCSIELENQKIAGNFSVFWGPYSEIGKSASNTGLLANTASGSFYGGFWLENEKRFLSPVRIRNSLYSVERIALNSDIICGKKNDQWTVKMHIKVK